MCCFLRGRKTAVPGDYFRELSHETLHQILLFFQWCEAFSLVKPVNSKLDWNDILAAIFEAK